jgi:hypothetical protein
MTLVRRLTKAEQTLIMATRPKALDGLSEDELLDLHARVRRGRNKYAELYRRGAGAQVGKDAARGKASAKNRKDAERSEVFEEALARVSRRLAREARRTAEALRDERLAPARAKAKKGTGAKTAGGGKTSGKGRAPSKGKTPASRKANASARATKARKQAKRDAR